MPIVVPLRGMLFGLKQNVAYRLGVPKETRPWLVVQSNSVPNKYGSVVACYTTCVVSTRGVRKIKGPLDVLLKADAMNGMFEAESFIVCSDLYTIRHDELDNCFGSVDPNTNTMKEVDRALRILLGLL